MSNKTEYLQESEIDLKELFLTLWRYKSFVLGFSSFVTLLSIIYIFMFKPVPIYEGNLIVSLGQAKTEKGMMPISNTHNLKVLLEAEASVNKNEALFNIKIIIPENTNGILKLVSRQYDKNLLKEEIEKSYLNLLKVEKEKIGFYKKYTKTKRIGFIHISDKPVNGVKKKLIILVSFISAFIISIVLVFIIEFIRSIRKEK